MQGLCKASRLLNNTCLAPYMHLDNLILLMSPLPLPGGWHISYGMLAALQYSGLQFTSFYCTALNSTTLFEPGVQK